MSFRDFGLSDEVLKAVLDAGYTTPTPIQIKAIPYILMGRDVLGCAQTGTGKTASFTLPLIDILANGRSRARMPRTLILEPTRELASQVADNFDVYGKYNNLTKALIIGGESMEEQTKILDRGVDVLIATPGRLLDLFERGGLLLNDVKILVIDETDRMLDMGFIPDVDKIVSHLNKIRQTLFFSATMPQEIRNLSKKYLINPKQISITDPSSSADNISQGVIMVHQTQSRDRRQIQKNKRNILRTLVKTQKISNALIFCNKKRDVDIVDRSLRKHGFNSGALHGDMSQAARAEVMSKFKSKEITLLVCSDVAARGIDIEDLSHVVNFDAPIHPEEYIHRIGRTGRAGKSGKAFTIVAKEDKKYLDAILSLTNKPIPVIELRTKTRKNQESANPPEARKATKHLKKTSTTQNKNALEQDDNGLANEKIIGMGHHVPAFLNR